MAWCKYTADGIVIVYFKIDVLCLKKLNFRIQANVMLEYELDDAASLLSVNIDTAKKQESNVEEDLDFLRFVIEYLRWKVELE